MVLIVGTFVGQNIVQHAPDCSIKTIAVEAESIKKLSTVSLASVFILIVCVTHPHRNGPETEENC
jgi:hypothetical protein